MTPLFRSARPRGPVTGEVYIVVGWFGAEEWIESVWATHRDASAECGRLWEERRSYTLDRSDYRQGVVKFGVETHPVRRLDG